MRDTVLKTATLQNDLITGLAKNEFFLEYQPIFDIYDNRFKGAEALVRWQHPIRGLLRPDEFIPIAEETGLILSIGEWVIHTVCNQLNSWHDKKIADKLEHVSINVSPWQFRQPDFTAMVSSIFEKTGVDPSSITLEITENVALDNLEDTINKMYTLKKLGISFRALRYRIKKLGID